MLSSDLPLFPLPNVVLFPQVCLPLHVFESRYRALLADALRGDRLIGIVLLKAGYEAEYEGRPPVYEVGCAGLITHAEPLSDGRSNIVLQGVHKFRVLGENHECVYRRARIEPLLDGETQAQAEALRCARHRLERLIKPAGEGCAGELKIPPTIPDAELINALAQYLPLEPLEKQALLEQPGVLERCHALIELLEMKAILTKSCRSSSFTH